MFQLHNSSSTAQCTLKYALVWLSHLLMSFLFHHPCSALIQSWLKNYLFYKFIPPLQTTADTYHVIALPLTPYEYLYYVCLRTSLPFLDLFAALR